MDINVLKNIGLTDAEINIYVSLLELGSSTATKIAAKNDMHRTNVYDVLGKLIKKGLVSSTIKNDTKYFNAIDPTALNIFIEGKKKELRKEEGELKKLIADLKSIKPLVASDQRIAIYQDRKGLESFYEKLIGLAKSKDELHIIGSSERIKEVFDYYLVNLSKRIAAVNIKGKMIASKDILRYQQMRLITKLVDIKVRFLEKDFLGPSATFIFRNYVGFCSFMENPFVLLIEDKLVSDNYKRYFDKLWKKAKK